MAIARGACWSGFRWPSPWVSGGVAAKFGLEDGDPGAGALSPNAGADGASEVDFTLFFSELTRVARGGEPEAFYGLKDAGEAAVWLASWRELKHSDAALEGMRRVNPVDPAQSSGGTAIRAGYAGDFSPFHQLVEALAEPYRDALNGPSIGGGSSEERVTATFPGRSRGRTAGVGWPRAERRSLSLLLLADSEKRSGVSRGAVSVARSLVAR